MDRILELTQRIARAFHPERIMLFGSHAYGNPGADSDVDILVILPFEGKACRKALEILNKTDPRFPLDLLARTPEQVRLRIIQGDFFLREVLEKGRVLYEANHERVGGEG